MAAIIRRKSACGVGKSGFPKKPAMPHIRAGLHARVLKDENRNRGEDSVVGA
jgi:hypothetical protein